MLTEQELQLIEASRKGDVNAASQLLLVTPPINLQVKDKYGWAPLHWLAWKNHVGAATLLVQAGIKQSGANFVEQLTEAGFAFEGNLSPLMLAAKAGSRKMLVFCLRTMPLLM